MNESYAPALREAVQQRDERHLRDILSRIPDEERPQQVNEPLRGDPSLLAAATTGRVGLMIALLEAGALVNGRRDQHGTTALIQAAAFGHADAVQTLLAHGADPTLVDRQGRTAEAIATGEALQVLVAHRERIVLRAVAEVSEEPAPRARRKM